MGRHSNPALPLLITRPPLRYARLLSSAFFKQLDPTRVEGWNVAVLGRDIGNAGRAHWQWCI
jgi:hypothetical protein